MSAATWGSPGAADPLCLRGRESLGGSHGGVGEPAQENGVQGEARRAPAPPSAPGPDPPVLSGPVSLPSGPISPRLPRPPARPGVPSACRLRCPGPEAGKGPGERPSTKAGTCHLPPAPLRAPHAWFWTRGSPPAVLQDSRVGGPLGVGPQRCWPSQSCSPSCSIPAARAAWA